MASNGRNSIGRKYRGVAPNASIIVVKITSEGVPAHDDQRAEAAFGGIGLILTGNGFYGRASAVSAAAPIVTGIIALMLQANPELDQLQVREILRNTARADAFTGIVPNTTWGYGKVDAFAAVRQAQLSRMPALGVSV